MKDALCTGDTAHVRFEVLRAKALVTKCIHVLFISFSLIVYEGIARNLWKC